MSAPISQWALLFAVPAFLAVSPGHALSTQSTRNVLSARAGAAAFNCTNPQRTLTVQGDPHVTSVPSLASVSLVPHSGGLTVRFSFREPFALAPEGVYISWTVYVFRHRSDADNPESTLFLQVEDRGKGWQPTGWTILASTYSSDSPVAGEVHTNKAHDDLTTFFPSGFANLRRPFYWFASQEEYRAYLPQDNKAAPQNWNINGAIFTDCPAGVRPDPNSTPDSAKLLTAAG